MDWQVFLTTFLMIFVAEMGDKTQFAALAASAGTESTFSVLLAVVLALAVAGTLGVVAGKYISGFITPQQMKWISGSLFLAIGFWTIFAN